MKLSSFTKPSDNFAGNVIKLMTGTVLAQTIGILVMPAVTRLFAPEAFGIAAVFSSMAGIIGVVVCLRYEYAIMLPESHEEAANILGVSLLSVIITTALSVLLICLGSETIIYLFKAPQLKNYLWLLPLAVFIQGIFLALNSWNTRKKHFGRLSIAQVVSSLTNQFTKLIAGSIGFVSGGVIIAASVLGNFFAAAILGVQIWQNDKKLFVDHIHWNAIGRGFVRYKKFLIIETWGGLLNITSWQLPAIMLSSFFSFSVVGFYSLAFTIVKAPLGIIGGALSNVFYQRACQNKNTHEGNKEFVEVLLDKLVFIGMLPLMMLTIIGEEIFLFLFGETWSEAGLYAQILTPWIFFWFVSSPLGTLFAVYERQEAALFTNSCIFITRLISLYIGGVYQNIYLALGLFSITGVVVYGAYGILNIKLANVSEKKISYIFMKYFIYFLPVCVCLFFIKYVMQFDHMIILTAALVLVVSYFVLFRRKYFSLLWSFTV